MVDPPAADVAEVDEEDIFGDLDRDEVESASALHADADGSQEELACGTASGPHANSPSTSKQVADILERIADLEGERPGG